MNIFKNQAFGLNKILNLFFGFTKKIPIMLKYILLSIAFVISSLSFVKGQTETEDSPTFSISGSVDTYFRVNLNGPNDTDEHGIVAPATSFANLPGFSLGMANIIGKYEGQKGGIVADLVFGPRGSDAVFASPLYSNSAQIINQLYAYWNISENTTITMGNFNTFLGYEVISPTTNFNYSTSYLFSYGPFSHTGLKVDYVAENGLSIMASILNPTDLTEFNPTSNYFFGGQIGYGGFYLNGLFGIDYKQIDLTGGIDLTEKLYIGINASVTDTGEDTGFGGLALYTQIQATKALKVGARYEFFKDKNTAFSDFSETTASDITLTANYSIGNLTILPEFRLDTNKEAIYLDSDGQSQKSLASFVLAFVYGF
jgi:hypothetical protein